MTRPLTIGTGALRLEIWPLGARLNRAIYAGIDCADGSETREQALGPKRFNGAVVGPVANRLAGGTVDIAGRTHSLPRNENDETTLHSGPDGVHALDWTAETVTSDSARLTLTLPDGHGGLPGTRQLGALYDVADHSFTLTFEATTDAPTLMNLALHPYWTLGAHRRADLALRIAADRYTPVDARKIPTGEIALVDGTLFDLRRAHTPSSKIDHNFCLTRSDPAIELTGSGLRLQIATDAPGLQVYTGKPLGIAIEPQHWPDAPHHPAFPSILLTPGQTYRQTSTYRFSRL